MKIRKLCIDSGGTKIHYGVFEDNKLIAEHKIIANGNLMIDTDGVFAIYDQIIAEYNPQQVLIGAAGLSGIQPLIIKFKQKYEQIQIQFIADIMLIAYSELTASNQLIGVLGTGSGFVYKSNDSMLFLGGNGHILGDFGSGYDLGREFINYWLELDQLNISNNNTNIIATIYNCHTRADFLQLVYNEQKQSVSSKVEQLLNSDIENKDEILNKVACKLKLEINNYCSKLNVEKIYLTGSVLNNTQYAQILKSHIDFELVENNLINGILNYKF